MPAKKPVLTASNADPRKLYEEAVQSVDAEIGFVDRTFRKLRGRTATRLREDFAGSAASACEWVRTRRANTAVAVDLDPDVLEWGRRHNVQALPEEARGRITLMSRDVRDPLPAARGVDIVLAMNFSYWVFKAREDLRGYFRSVRRSLVKDGVLFMDFYGGTDAGNVLRERRRCKGFTYVWDQAKYNPITGDMHCRIHFEFRDGTVLRNAFEYHWRLWSLPEVRELLAEAGFARSTVYWEGDDGNGGGNGVFRPSTKGEVCRSWIAYLVAEK